MPLPIDSVSSDVETNPGLDYPCGSSGREVSDDGQATVVTLGFTSSAKALEMIHIKTF